VPWCIGSPSHSPPPVTAWSGQRGGARVIISRGELGVTAGRGFYDWSERDADAACDLFGIAHPIINAPMAGSATADLAAAVPTALPASATGGAAGVRLPRCRPPPSWRMPRAGTRWWMPGPAAPRAVCWPTPSPERRPFVCCKVANRLLSGTGQPLVRMVRFGRRRRGPWRYTGRFIWLLLCGRPH
jgi:hypothetical protein